MNYYNIYSLISDLEEKGYNEGLTVDECVKLLNELDVELKFLASSDQKWKKLYDRMRLIANQIYASDIFNFVSSNNYDYILKNAFLLPLVLANNNDNDVILYSRNSYKFSCQFHTDSRPSMGVTDIRNLLFCFSCKKSLNSVTYLKEFENLSYRQAIELLSKIYLFDINNKNNSFSNLVDKYQSSIVSDEYRILLEKGFIRLKNRGISSINGIDVNKHYEDVFFTIDRVCSGIYDPNFKYEEPSKKIVLKRN